jgi:predicted Fe-Mo cluster-binding NifX family protein
MSMKVAVASMDGVSISQHFGRSSCFIVFEVENGKIKNREIRNNTYTAFARENCHSEAHADQPHSHSAIVGALGACEAVLASGMGWRVAEDLDGKGIQPFILGTECFPEEAVSLFLGGKLQPRDDQFCRCHEE